MLFITCLLSICIYGQQVTFGMKGGVNIATLVSQNSGNAGTKIAYHAGVLGSIPISTNWSIQPEILYSRQGINQSVSGSTYHINLDYANIPILFQLLLTTKLKVQAGPQLGFLLSAKNIYLDVEKDITSNYKTVDFSLPIGFCYTWVSGFGIDGRWVPGLTQIQVNYGSSKNSVVQFGAFYHFNKGNKKYTGDLKERRK